MVVIPFTSVKATFTCQCGNYLFRFTTLFNDYNGVWHVDLSDEQTGEVICYQIPILLGQDLLGPFNLGIGAIIAVDMSDTGIDAGPDDLGDRVIVCYYAPEELPVAA